MKALSGRSVDILAALPPGKQRFNCLLAPIQALFE